MTQQLDLLRKIRFGSLSREELTDIYNQNKNEYRILLHLAMHPHFPEHLALNIVSRLFPIDLLTVIKTAQTAPGIRKKAEQEFCNKYPRLPLGEKISYMKRAPAQLMEYFIEETDSNVLTVMLTNPNCTEELVVKFLNRRQSRYKVYEVLQTTSWYKQPRITEAIAADKEASIRIISLAIPFMNIQTLQKLHENPDTHVIVKNNIIDYLNKRKKDQKH